MLKKAGVVAAAAIGLSLIAAPASAAADPVQDMGVGDTVGVEYGATSVVTGIYTGIAIAPLIAISFDD